MPTNDDQPPGAAVTSRWGRRITVGLAMVATAGLAGGVLAACSTPSPAAHTAPASQRTSRTAQPGASQPPTGSPLDAAVATSATAADAGLPSFFVIASQGDPNGLQVRSSATGKLISSVTSPGPCMPATYQVAAAGNDRDFVFSCLSLTSRRNIFYQLRVSSRGATAGLTSLPIPPISSTFVTGLAVTPDGREVAIGLKNNTTGNATIELVTPATGAIRTWTAHMDRPTLLSWADNGRELGFWAWGLRVLDVGAAGHNLASARLILSIFHKSDLVQNAMLSPDGATIIADVSYQLPRGTRPTPSTVVGGIAEVAAGTGKTTRLFIAQHVQGNSTFPCQLGAIDATGHHVLAGCTQFDRVDRGRVTALPGNDIQAAFSGAW
ncbi:MAG TPA: hypothetical protein VGJ19_02005 [Streptosporangiaceae bacterium]